MGLYGPMGPGGFRRRGRRRGLVVGAAVGAAAARHSNKKQPDEAAGDTPDYETELNELASLKAKNLITDEEYDAKRKQILGL